MTPYLNAGFGEPLPAPDLMLIERLGWEGIRQDVPDPDVADLLVRNALGSGLSAIFVLPMANPTLCQETAHAVARAAVELGLADHAVLEAGNEEDLRGKRWANDPYGWSMLVQDVSSIAWDHNNALRVVSGGVSSLSKDAMRWLERSKVREVPAYIGYHQYRETGPREPLSGYRSREDEFNRLRDVAGGQGFWCTECGWHTSQRKKGWWIWSRTWSYTDEQVADFLREEIELNHNAGAHAFVTYQLNDGPDPNNDQDRFGIRRTDGSLKPSAFVLDEEVV